LFPEEFIMRTSPPIAPNDEPDQGTPEQTIPIGLMIKRLEDANARAHKKAAPVDKPKPIQVPDGDIGRHSSEQTRPAIPDLRSLRVDWRLALPACYWQRSAS